MLRRSTGYRLSKGAGTLTVKHGMHEKAYMEAVEQQLREELVKLIDEEYLAYKASGRSVKEYQYLQFYEHLLFQAVNSPTLSTLYRIGALKVIRLYILSVIEAYQHQKRRK